MRWPGQREDFVDSVDGLDVSQGGSAEGVPVSVVLRLPPAAGFRMIALLRGGSIRKHSRNLLFRKETHPWQTRNLESE